MSQQLFFVSFLSNAASSGSINLTLQTNNPLFQETSPVATYTPINTTIALSVTGVIQGMDPVSIANLANTQFNTQLLQASAVYAGSPVFSSQIPNATFRIGQTDHVLSFFSQSLFTITASSNTTGAIVNLGPKPSLVTTGYIRSNAGLAAVPLVDVNGVTLTDTQLAFMSSVMSSQLITLLGMNYIVICTFLLEETGNYQLELDLTGGIPGIWFDGIRVKRPYSVSLYGTLVGDSTSIVWNYITKRGKLRYIPAQNLTNTYEPTFWGNELKVSYVAGNNHIPDAIGYGILRLLGAGLQNRYGIASLKTGSFDVKYFNQQLLDQIVSELYFYNLNLYV